ncbi:nucleotidyltransferase [Capnocytophaga granulosa]|jgi:hypothetical protein|uniref:nucleotidyltransferase n=1 Tax=Capnocytophaga granulosa TaxID=45242 RepID=UPI0023F3F645|nr:nucleotidyltransferase [Capnocytophaga granulosa]
MARTIQEIQELIYQAKTQEPALNELNSASKVAIWRLWVYIISVAIWSLEKLFDLHRTDIDKRLAELTPHTARWYRNKALAFQYGFDLLPDSDKFNNTGHTEEQIEASKIVKYSAVVESEDGRLIVKIATESDGRLLPITEDQHNAFKGYIAEIKDAGVRATVINYLPDKLVLNLDVYYDPLILDSNGMDILSAKLPVKEAIEIYLKNLPFNGELIVAHLVDALQAVNGVKIPHLKEVTTAWIDPNTRGYGSFENINVSQIPYSGYFEVDWNESRIRYIAK